MVTTTPTGVLLQWTSIGSCRRPGARPVFGEYNVYRDAGNTGYLFLNNTSATAYLDTDIDSGVSYTYKVEGLMVNSDNRITGVVTVLLEAATIPLNHVSPEHGVNHGIPPLPPRGYQIRSGDHKLVHRWIPSASVDELYGVFVEDRVDGHAAGFISADSLCTGEWVQFVDDFDKHCFRLRAIDAALNVSEPTEWVCQIAGGEPSFWGWRHSWWSSGSDPTDDNVDVAGPGIIYIGPDLGATSFNQLVDVKAPVVDCPEGALSRYIVKTIPNTSTWSRNLITNPIFRFNATDGWGALPSGWVHKNGAFGHMSGTGVENVEMNSVNLSGWVEVSVAANAGEQIFWSDTEDIPEKFMLYGWGLNAGAECVWISGGYLSVTMIKLYIEYFNSSGSLLFAEAGGNLANYANNSYYYGSYVGLEATKARLGIGIKGGTSQDTVIKLSAAKLGGVGSSASWEAFLGTPHNSPVIGTAPMGIASPAYMSPIAAEIIVLPDDFNWTQRFHPTLSCRFWVPDSPILRNLETAEYVRWDEETQSSWYKFHYGLLPMINVELYNGDGETIAVWYSDSTNIYEFGFGPINYGGWTDVTVQIPSYSGDDDWDSWDGWFIDRGEPMPSWVPGGLLQVFFDFDNYPCLPELPYFIERPQVRLNYVASGGGFKDGYSKNWKWDSQAHRSLSRSSVNNAHRQLIANPEFTTPFVSEIFGNTDEGGNAQSLFPYMAAASKFSIPERGIVTNVFVLLDTFSDVTLKAFVYSDSGGPATLMAVSNPTSVGANYSGWFPLSTIEVASWSSWDDNIVSNTLQNILTPGNYWVGVCNADFSGEAPVISYDVGGESFWGTGSLLTFENFPNTWNIGITLASRRYSIYATYEVPE